MTGLSHTSSGIVSPERRGDDGGEKKNKVSGVTPGNSRALNVASIVLLFVAIGPPVGGVFYCILGTVALFLQNLPPKGFFEIILSALWVLLMVPISIVAAPYSYLYGAAPAAAAGLAIGMLRLKYGGLNVPLVLAVGAVVGIIYPLALPRLPSAEFPKFIGQSGLGAAEICRAWCYMRVRDARLLEICQKLSVTR